MMSSISSGAHPQRAGDHDAHDRGAEDHQEKRHPDCCHDGTGGGCDGTCGGCVVRDVVLAAQQLVDRGVQDLVPYSGCPIAAMLGS